MKLRLCICLLLALACIGQSLRAQRHYFLSYSVNEGLAQSQVRDIAQSDDGYLWIATVGGISRFDGVHFETYNKANGLLNNLTNALHPGKNGSMIASCPGGVVTFEGAHSRSFPFGAPYEEVLTNDILDYESGYLLASNGEGLLFFNGRKITSAIDLGSTGKNFIRSLSWHGDSILAGTKSGLLMVHPSGTHRVINDSISVTDIVVDGDDYWIATNGNGLFRYRNKVLEQLGRSKGLENRYIRDISLDRNGNLWILSKNNIQILNKLDLSFSSIRSFDEDQTSNMKVVFTDREQNVWIGTDGYGILRFTGDQFELFNTEDGLSSNIVMDIEQDHTGDYVFATYGYGVVIWRDKLKDNILNDQGLPNLTVWCLLPVQEEVWFGTSEGIQILKQGKVSPFVRNANLPFPRVSNLFQDSDGRIWIATRDGVTFWNGEELLIPIGLENETIKDCKGVIEFQNSIWIASSNGLIEWKNNGQFKRYGKDDGLAEPYITCIKSGNNNDIWLGSEEGLINFNLNDQVFRKFNLSDRVSSNIINFIENEGNKRLWLGTDNGLFQINLEEYVAKGDVYIKGYNKYDGIISNEYNQNASYTDKDGNVWFGTNGGLIRFNTAKSLKYSSTVLGINIIDIQQNFESIFNSVDWDSSDHAKNTFQHNESRLTFKFAAVHFTNPDKVVYSYRLLGLDEEWSPPTQENYITYSSLPSGDFSFEVKARVGDGEWHQTQRPFIFYVAPPIYLKWWFIVITLLVMILIVLLIVYQIRKEQKRKRQLEDMKTKAKVLGLEQQTLNAHMNRHFIFNALNSIQYYINTQDRKQANQYLTNFASLVRKNLDSAQVDSTSLRDELDRLALYVNLEQMRFKDRFEFEVITDSNVDLESIYVPSMILQPFVENSIMHGILPSSLPGTIKVYIKLHPDGISVTIDDNGIGIETSVNNKSGTSLHVSNGMKITKQRIEIIAQAYNNAYGVTGPFEIKDEQGIPKGTRVQIILPSNFQTLKDFYQKKY